MAAPDRTRAGLRFRPGLVLLLLVVAVLAAQIAIPRRGPPATLAPTPVLSRGELAGEEIIARDGGYSAPLPAAPGRSLWLFGDTPVYVRHTRGAGRPGWALERFIAGSTAAVGSAVTGPGGRVPGPLSEVGTPVRAGPAATARRGTGEAPAPFLAAPAGLVTALGSPCGTGGSYAVSWISGVARVPATPDLLVTFNNYCVLPGSGGFLHEGFGLAEYDPAAQRLSNDVTVLAGDGPDGAVSAAPLGSPVFAGRYLYLFGPACAAPRRGRCAGTMVQARVPATPAAWADPFSYQWWAGGRPARWTSDAGAANPIIPGPAPSGVSVGDFAAAGHGFVLVEQTGVDGAFTVRESSSPAGPWKMLTSGRVACRLGPGYANFCRTIIGQPELSTPAQLVLSYFDPVAETYGHVMVVGLRW